MPEQKILKGKDVVNGKYGTAFAVIEDSRYELFEIVDFDGKANQHKSTIPRLGAFWDAHKVVGGEGKWTAKMRYVSDKFRKMISEADKTHKTVYFDLQITNDDPDSAAGRHSSVFKECTLDEISMAKLDAANTHLDESVSGTFDMYISAEEFTEI